MTDLTFHEFLVEHAKFPFPNLSIGDSASTTDISDIEVGQLQKSWKAIRAVRDNDLATKLCHTLETILADTPLTEDSKNFLLRWLLPAVLVDADGMEEDMWFVNPHESHVSVILVPREFKLILWGRAGGY